MTSFPITTYINVTYKLYVTIVSFAIEVLATQLVFKRKSSCMGSNAKVIENVINDIHYLHMFTFYRF